MNFIVPQNNALYVKDPAITPNLRKVPLVLAGPILRHVDADSVTIWLALQHDRQVDVRVLELSAPNAPPVNVLGEATETPVKLGSFLYVACVTVPVTTPLSSGNLYGYDIRFVESDGSNSTPWVFEYEPEGIVKMGDYQPSLTYGNWKWPTFSLSPTDLNFVRILHGSCRKPHGEGTDALTACDKMLELAQLDSTGCESHIDHAA